MIQSCVKRQRGESSRWAESRLTVVQHSVRAHAAMAAVHSAGNWADPQCGQVVRPDLNGSVTEVWSLGTADHDSSGRPESDPAATWAGYTNRRGTLVQSALQQKQPCFKVVPVTR